ncbi:MAG: hypothetical protein LUE26_02730 [Alistipes sp.]|nr:hypothetical protein [Alistipes sp.]
MKYIKFIGAALTAVLLAAGCDDSDGYTINTTNAVVGFEQTVISLKETEEFVTIPIVIENDTERDGDIIVHAAMKSTNAGFEKDRDIMITTETFRIPPELGSINFEVALDVYTPEITTGRNVEFQITSVSGASVGANGTCRIDFVEQNFVEGVYIITGQNMIYETRATARVSVSTTDETLDNVWLNFGIGTLAKMNFTEIEPELEYDVEIEPFQFIGIYNSYSVYVTWIASSKADDDPDTVELLSGLYYDRTRPVKAKLVRKIENGRETSLVITFEDGFGLLGILNETTYNWFDNFKPGATMEKAD